MGKITVKHYLNTNLKPYIIDGEKLYKLYFLVRYNNKNTKIRSLINEEITAIEYKERTSNPNDILSIRIKNEVNFIESIINIADKTNTSFDIELFNDIWMLATYPIIKKFSNYIEYLTERINRAGYMDFMLTDNYYEFNIIKYYEVLNSLKKYVSNSQFSISDELYLLQFFDEKIIADYYKNISDEDKEKEIYITEKDSIATRKEDFKLTKIDNLDIIKDALIRKDYFDGYYLDQSPEIKKTGNSTIDKKYFNTIFSLISGY